MRLERRTYLLWGVLALALAGLFGARAFGVIPANIDDLLARGLPALLVLVGIALLLRGRIPLSSLIAIVMAGALVTALTLVAFSQRAREVRTGTQQTLLQPLGVATLLRLRISSGATDVELVRTFANTADRAITGEFVGSTESSITSNFETAADGSATLTITEIQSSPFPSLEAVGRGTLQLEIPAALPLDVEFTAADGDVTLNMDGLALERLNVAVARGDLVVTIPDYAPLLVESGVPNGTLSVNDGALAIFIPANIAARFTLNRGGSGIQPQYDANRYNYLQGDVLETRTIESAESVVGYTLNVPRGLIRVEVLE